MLTLILAIGAATQTAPPPDAPEVPSTMSDPMAKAPAPPTAPPPPDVPRIPPPNIDTTGDGTLDAWDLDDDGKADLYDTNGDGRPDKADNDGDGTPETAVTVRAAPDG